MDTKPTLPLAELMPADPALALLRLAALSATTPDGGLDDDTLDLMFEQVEDGALAGLEPTRAWPELARGLMGRAPSNLLRTLAACRALPILLPEVAALFGVPQIADDPPQVDIGQHLLRVLDEAARCEAPLAVRFAALVMHVGKADSPPEHWPVHYRHVERGRPRIEALCQRFGVPEECRDLALLALAECERVHRVGRVRAGPVALLLERVDAFNRPERFAQLLTLCTCDYRAYGRQTRRDYPKAALLTLALKACAGLDHGAAQSADPEAAERLREARAAAIAAAFGSERWSEDTD
ncbi:tRNA nucleotidyltransferase [Candidatus Methylocalor cossyra]|uniref:tRNA nucleotidyltransferase n=1 Tax=Candidatus Methylocalor cossyra TaxID=3108543 RepID=A0ABP1CB23_9GAMM